VAKYLEPVMHLVAIGWPLSTAIAGAVMGVYDELDLDTVCWIDNYPKGCSADCTLGQNEPEGCYDDCTSDMIAWVAFGMWMLFVLISVIVNNLIIYVYVLRTTRRVTTRRRGSFLGNANAQLEKIQMVRTQALLYVGSFFMCYTWSLILHVLEQTGYSRTQSGNSLYVLLLLQAFFRPMAGVFNMLVYLRPRYMQCRKQNPNQSKLWCLVKVIHGTSHIGRHRGPSHGSRRSQSRESGNEVEEYTSTHISTVLASLARLQRPLSMSFAFRNSPDLSQAMQQGGQIQRDSSNSNNNNSSNSNNNNDLNLYNSGDDASDSEVDSWMCQDTSCSSHDNLPWQVPIQEERPKSKSVSSSSEPNVLDYDDDSDVQDIAATIVNLQRELKEAVASLEDGLKSDDDGLSPTSEDGV